MSSTYRDVGHGVLATEAAMAQLDRVDLLVFDVDGVLIDVHDTYPRVISETVQWYWTRSLGRPADGTVITPEETALFKRAGGFNSDWNLARAACLHALWRWHDPGAPDLPSFTAELGARGGGLEAALALMRERARPGAADAVLAEWDPQRIERLCCEHYGGDEDCRAMFGFEPVERHGPALWRAERPLVDPARLTPWRGRLSVYTGRNVGETRASLRRWGLEDLFPDAGLITCDSGWRKPQPEGLQALADRFRPAVGLFAGDNVDDGDTVTLYRRVAAEGAPPFLFAGVLGGSPGEAAAGLFRARGADLIVPSVDALADALSAAARDSAPPGVSS